MPDDLQAIVQRMVEAGESESDIALVIQHAKAQPTANAEAKPDLGRFGGYKMIGDAVVSAVKGAAKHPIATGALLGGAVAAPVTGGASIPAAMAAAGLGGAGGAGLGMLYNAVAGQEDSPTTAKGVLGRMGTEGALQAGMEGGGRVLAKGAQALAGQMYRGALRPAASIRAKYPNVVEQGLEDAVVVGPRSAPVKAKRLAMASKGDADTIRAAAQAAGSGPVPRSELTAPLMQMARESRRAAELTGGSVRRNMHGQPIDDAVEIVQRARSLKPTYALDEAHEAARILNDRADAAFRMEQRGGTPRSVQANMDQALARAFSGGVKARVPGLAEVNKTTSTRMGLSKALGAAAERPGVLGNIMAGSTGIGTYANTNDPEKAMLSALAMKGLFSPRGLSTGAIGLHQVGKLPISNAARAAFLARLFGQDE